VDGLAQLRADRIAHEIRRRPYLVEVAGVREPHIRKLRKLPRPVADVVFARAKRIAVVVVDVARLGRVDMDDVDRVGILGSEAAQERIVAVRVLAVQLERNDSHRDADSVAGLHHAARRLADAEVRAVEADHVHAQLEPWSRCREAIWRVPVREVEERLFADREAFDAKLAVLVLLTEALQRAMDEPGQRNPAGFAAQPPIGIAPVDTEEPQLDCRETDAARGREFE
jgi:hypothetical protein